MRIVFLRHAPVEKRYEKCFNGWSDIGIEKIDEKVASDLKNRLSKYRFDNIYSSDLKRCKDTLRFLGLNDFKEMKEFREIRFKSFCEGRTFEDIQKNVEIPKEAFLSLENWMEFATDESLGEFLERIERGLKRVKGREVLICTHKGVIEAALKIYTNQEFFSRKISYLDIIEINTLLIKN